MYLVFSLSATYGLLFCKVQKDYRTTQNTGYWCHAVGQVPGLLERRTREQDDKSANVQLRTLITVLP